jgi:hypothetical protein
MERPLSKPAKKQQDRFKAERPGAKVSRENIYA